MGVKGSLLAGALQWTICAILSGMRFIDFGLMYILTSSTSLHRRLSKRQLENTLETPHNRMIRSSIYAVRRSEYSEGNKWIR